MAASPAEKIRSATIAFGDFVEACLDSGAIWMPPKDERAARDLVARTRLARPNY